MQQNGGFFFDNDQYDGIELDFDDHLKDLVAEFEQVKSEPKVVESTQTGHIDVSPIQAEEDAIYAGERDSCCGEDEVHDYALDSTYNSFHKE